MRNGLAAILIFTVTSLAVAYSPSEEEFFANREKEICSERATILEEKTFENYRVTISHTDDYMCQMLDIRKNEQLVYHVEEVGAHFVFGSDHQPRLSAFSRLTDSNNMNLVISNWTGGAHCCFSLHIFSLGDHFSKIATIEGGNSVPLFKDLDRDGIPEIEVDDDVFAYRFSCFAESPYGRVVLKFESGEYRVAREHMIRVLPQNYRFNRRKVEKWKKQFDETDGDDLVPHEILQAITDLVFSDNEIAGRELLDEVWPDTLPGKENFWAEYQETLHESRYYGAFKQRE